MSPERGLTAECYTVHDEERTRLFTMFGAFGLCISRINIATVTLGRTLGSVRVTLEAAGPGDLARTAPVRVAVTGPSLRRWPWNRRLRAGPVALPARSGAAAA